MCRGSAGPSITIDVYAALPLAVHFTSRVQLALNVDNLDESIAFYSRLFGVGPAKTRPGYANFAVAEPPLKLVLMEKPRPGRHLEPPRRGSP